MSFAMSCGRFISFIFPLPTESAGGPDSHVSPKLHTTYLRKLLLLTGIWVVSLFPLSHYPAAEANNFLALLFPHWQKQCRWGADHNLLLFTFLPCMSPLTIKTLNRKLSWNLLFSFLLNSLQAGGFSLKSFVFLSIAFINSCNSCGFEDGLLLICQQQKEKWIWSHYSNLARKYLVLRC